MNFTSLKHIRFKGSTWASLIAALLAACSSPPPPPVTAPPIGQPKPSQAGQVKPPVSITRSQAGTAREYRKDAAAHLYQLNGDRIYKGRLPPMLYAIGVLDIELDRQGQVLGTHWKRAPTHAPEVMAEIEQTVRKAAPYPVPARLGKVTYTDVWLWHKSGKFQLDTLTEGQD